MPSLHQESLTKRAWCYGNDCSNTWTWARWILFVLFIVGIIIVILSAIRVNKRRGLEGRAPIMGTAWITPPSYQQSQRQQTQQEPYVPPYTAQANDQDLGYYDAQGQFHTNTKAQMAQQDVTYRLNTLVPDQTGLSEPQPVQVTGQNPNEDFNRQFQRYYGQSTATNNTPPQAQASTSSDSSENYAPPAGPPPAHTRK
ncbi:Protein RCR2 [Cyberlindnera fabianii]|uniref:Protein RCR2 n=1 Tax=Cyberlindnera fabianii TaxID=36022 RepID=A0A1V2L3B3_CYBFA|nr:Protein RCR2 [Cyberlindnera fabianii]